MGGGNLVDHLLRDAELVHQLVMGHELARVPVPSRQALLGKSEVRGVLACLAERLVLAVLVAVLLPVTPFHRPNRLKEATDIGLNGLIGRSTPEGELRLDRVPHPYHPGLVKIL